MNQPASRRSPVGRFADRLLEGAAVVVALTMLAVVVASVAFRALGNPLAWSDELAQYLLVWLGLIGWMIASRRRSHIRIVVLLDRLPEVARRFAEVAIRLAIIAFAAVLLWQSRGLIVRNIDIEAVTLPFPSALLYVLLPLLALVLIVQATAEIVEQWAPAAPPPDGGGKAL